MATFIFKESVSGVIIVKPNTSEYAPNGQFLGIKEGKIIKYTNGSLETKDPDVIKFLEEPTNASALGCERVDSK